MTKDREFTNSSMNNSSALVAPTRSEIRISFSIEYPSISSSTKKKLRRAAFVVTFLLIVAASFCNVFDVQMSRSYATVLVVLASIGILYCSHSLWNKFGGWKGILNEEEKEATNE